MRANYTRGLIHYWPILRKKSSKSLDSSLVNIFTGEILKSITPTYALDRNNVSNATIAVRGSRSTTWELPPSVYFNGSFSVLAWIRIYSCKKNSPFLACSNRNFPTDIFFVQLLSVNGTCKLRIKTASDQTFSENIDNQPALPIDEWTHLAICRTPQTTKVYLNGSEFVDFKENATSLPSGVYFEQCLFGGIHHSDFHRTSDDEEKSYVQPANADFDEIKFFNRSLSQQEIAYDYANIESFTYEL
jgi:hypothetical protein